MGGRGDEGGTRGRGDYGRVLLNRWLRLAVPTMAAKIALSSRDSRSNSVNAGAGAVLDSLMISSQNDVSSASSATTAMRAVNS